MFKTVISALQNNLNLYLMASIYYERKERKGEDTDFSLKRRSSVCGSYIRSATILNELKLPSSGNPNRHPLINYS